MPCRRGRSFAFSGRNCNIDVEEGFEIPQEFFNLRGAFRFGRRGRGGFGPFPPHHFWHPHHPPHFHHGHHFEEFEDDVPPPPPPPPHFEEFGVPPPPPPPFGHHPHPHPPFRFHRGRHFRRGGPYGEGDEGLFSRSCMRTHVGPNEVNVIVHQNGVTEENTQVTFEEGRIIVQGWIGEDCRQFYHSSLLPEDIVADSAEVVIIDDRVHVCVYRSQNQQDQQNAPNAPNAEEDLVHVQHEPNAPNQPIDQQGENVQQMSYVLEGNDDVLVQGEENVQDLDGYVDVMEEDRLMD